ncbi:MAG: magnesium/cobalt transporter CorA [Longimicrobiales bacterium]|nr:magnesium/cobalt transporter CorA [Longimicrobiales bacterium]
MTRKPPHRGHRLGSALGHHLRRLALGHRHKKGAPPGTVVYVGHEATEPVRLSFMDYHQDSIVEGGRAPGEVVSLEDCRTLLDGPRNTWINVDGLSDVDLVQALADHVGLHRLAQEDIVHPAQRPKLEDYPDHIYLVLRMLGWDAEGGTLRDEQLSLILGRGYVLTFQERRGDVFDGVRERLRTGRGTIRTRGADYLAYALMDSLVDHYFLVLEALSDRVEAVELSVLESPETEVLHALHHLKRELIAVRRSVWPLRDVLGQLYRDPSEFVDPSTRVYLRDVHDHAVQVIDTVETLRDLSGGLVDLYMTGVSNRMNEVMKVLTIFASIFIPLTFLAGLYGMNFDVMPELHLPWAYPALLLVMAAGAVAMLAWFRRKGWL